VPGLLPLACSAFLLVGLAWGQVWDVAGAHELATSPRVQVVVGEEDRQPSADPAVGRLRKARKGDYLFCTATLVGPSCAVTAGHCSTVFEVMEFDLEIVPNRFTYARPENLFEVDRDGVIKVAEGKGRDWAVLPLKTNRKTGRSPGADRPYYDVATEPPVPGQTMIMAGYGASKNPYAFSQQSSRGSLTTLVTQENGPTYVEHTLDSGSSSSGSALRDAETGHIVAIHTHGDSDRQINSGTLVGGFQTLAEAIEACERRGGAGF
jgi:V8-like Glu-specific endopeptidase